MDQIRYIPIRPISLCVELINAMGLGELADRMDQSFEYLCYERNQPAYLNGFRKIQISEFVKKEIFSQFNDDEKRKLVYLLFEYLFQGELATSQSLFATIGHPLRVGDESILRHVEYYAALQGYIIEARVVCEIAMKLVHFIYKKTDLECKGSCRKAFNKFIEGNPQYAQFKFLAEIAKEYSSNYRDAEVHFGTRFKKQFLTLMLDDIIYDQNKYHSIVNTMFQFNRLLEDL